MVCFVCLSVSLMIWWWLLLLLIIPHREHCINITYTHCSTLYLLLRLIFLYILYIFIFISDSLENIKNHWVQFKAHTQTYTHRKKCSSFLLRLSLSKYFLCECQKTVKQMRTNDFLLKAKNRIWLSANHGPSPFKLPSKYYTSFAKQLFLVRMRM